MKTPDMWAELKTSITIGLTLLDMPPNQGCGVHTRAHTDEGTHLLSEVKCMVGYQAVPSHVWPNMKKKKKGFWETWSELVSLFFDLEL